MRWITSPELCWTFSVRRSKLGSVLTGALQVLVPSPSRCPTDVFWCPVDSTLSFLLLELLSIFPSDSSTRVDVDELSVKVLASSLDKMKSGCEELSGVFPDQGMWSFVVEIVLFLLSDLFRPVLTKSGKRPLLGTSDFLWKRRCGRLMYVTLSHGVVESAKTSSDDILRSTFDSSKGNDSGRTESSKDLAREFGSTTAPLGEAQFRSCTHRSSLEALRALPNDCRSEVCLAGTAGGPEALFLLLRIVSTTCPDLMAFSSSNLMISKIKIRH